MWIVWLMKREYIPGTILKSRVSLTSVTLLSGILWYLHCQPNMFREEQQFCLPCEIVTMVKMTSGIENTYVSMIRFLIGHCFVLSVCSFQLCLVSGWQVISDPLEARLSFSQHCKNEVTQTQYKRYTYTMCALIISFFCRFCVQTYSRLSSLSRLQIQPARATSRPVHIFLHLA